MTRPTVFDPDTAVASAQCSLTKWREHLMRLGIFKHLDKVVVLRLLMPGIYPKC